MRARSAPRSKAARRRSSPAKRHAEAPSTRARSARNWKTSTLRRRRYAGRAGSEEPIRRCSWLPSWKAWGFDSELRCVLGVQALPAAELHGLGADDAADRFTREQAVENVQADVPACRAHRDESAID